jgi:hypothetical protein
MPIAGSFTLPKVLNSYSAEAVVKIYPWLGCLIMKQFSVFIISVSKG